MSRKGPLIVDVMAPNRPVLFPFNKNGTMMPQDSSLLVDHQCYGPLATLRLYVTPIVGWIAGIVRERLVHINVTWVKFAIQMIPHGTLQGSPRCRNNFDEDVAPIERDRFILSSSLAWNVLLDRLDENCGHYCHCTYPS